MAERNVRLGFTDSRQGVLAAIYRMGVISCAYSSAGTWAERCDCKYGVADVERWPTLSETGNGCPELRSVYGVIAAMTDDEWAELVRRAGGTLRSGAPPVPPPTPNVGLPEAGGRPQPLFPSPMRREP